ncbi:MAG: hypothetical protein LBU90_10480 [Bacteroidales bacterium]|nr:hypothetical protein [Bacteroidales bacterium]
MNGILIDNETSDLLVQVTRNAQGKITRGVLVGDCRADVAERILQAYPGEFKEHPTLGCDIKQQINGTASPFWRGHTMSQLRSEGIEVENLTINENGVQLSIKS